MKIEEFALELLRRVGIAGALTALRDVEEIYQTVHGRSAYDDIGSLGWIEAIARGRTGSGDVEFDIRSGDEHRVRTESVIRSLYRELLLRDPGPANAGEPWRDPSALGYVDDFQMGKRSEEDIREEIKTSDEYKNKHRATAVGAISVKNFALSDGGRDRLMVGMSLFYAMSPAVKRDRYVRVMDSLAASGVEMARFAQTFTWDNTIQMANVIPFKPGNTYEHKEGVDAGKKVSWRPSDDHFAELDWRLRQAAERGIHVQYTIFWGGMQPLFTLDADGKQRPPGYGGHQVLWDRVEEYSEYIGRFFKDHPAHTLEIINEADHFHHLAKLGCPGRKEFFRRVAASIRKYHPGAVLSASDGGHGPQVDCNRRKPAPEGSPYFDYHDVAELDYYNIHFPRETVSVQGIPRWCRGSWHLYQDRGPFRQNHPDKGYGRSDENIWLTTEAEFKKWSYRGSSRDWHMYALSMWCTAMAGAGFTVHNFKGFFFKDDVADDPIFRLGVRAYRDITDGFQWQGSAPFNAGWNDSPVRDFNGPFKAFSIVSGSKRKAILTTVLNPAGVVRYDLDGAYEARVFDIEGRTLKVERIVGKQDLRLPTPAWKHGAVVRLDRV